MKTVQIKTAELAGAKLAPWPDFNGRQIKEGASIIHPDGTRGTVYVRNANADEDAWVVDYGDSIPARLVLQVGFKGKAVVEVPAELVGEGV